MGVDKGSEGRLDGREARERRFFGELLITFQNGEKKIFDAKPILSLPLYAPLRNKGFFDTAKADGMCVYWNEDVDLCPDMVYTDSRPA